MKMLRYMTPFLGLILLSCGLNDVGSSNRSTGGDEDDTPGLSEDENHIVLSQMHRTRENITLTSLEEIARLISGVPSSVYRKVPNIKLDDEGTVNGNVISRSVIARPRIDCGNKPLMGGIDNRIIDCLKVVADRASWSGSNFGAAGEASWKLVQYNKTDNQEIWLDTKTGLVWSDVIEVGNWCQASGNIQKKTDTGLPDGIDCSIEQKGESYCTKYEASNLGNAIVWRLPTRNDYLQADLDGLRLVLDNKNSTFWTATLVSGVANRDQAWLYNDGKGTLTSDDMRNNHRIRCVGSPSRL